MNTAEFSNWLLSNGSSKKIASDIVSRLKRINYELIESIPSTNIDEQYNIDGCKLLLNSFNRNSSSNRKLLLKSSLPFNKPEIANYKLSLSRYIKHLNNK